MSLLASLFDLVFPRSCAACGGAVGENEGHVCWDCRAGFPPIVRPFCSHCGDPVEGAVRGPYVCSLCRRHRPLFDRARSAVRWRGPVRRVVHELKYRQAACLAVDLAPWLAGCVRAEFADAAFDAIVCVPLHRRRERERTYNQSHLLAAALAREVRLPFAPGKLLRVRGTETQTHLSAAARRNNVRGAFAAADPAWIEGRRLLLVDDVMTTGATVAECSRVLKDAGAAEVYVVTVARG